MNTNDKKVRHLTLDEIRNGCVETAGGDNENAEICRIAEEFRQGIDSVEPYKKSVTFYGSARFDEHNVYYKKARSIAHRIATELGYPVITGGGPGIMEAGNRGAYDAGGKSVGLTIKLPKEQYTNPYVTDAVPFYFFFARKVTLSYMAEACLFFPGGFGTLDELFGMLTLIQTGKIEQVPIILVGGDFWKPLDELIRTQMLEKNQAISPDDINIYQILDDETEILKIIKNAKMVVDNGLQ